MRLEALEKTTGYRLLGDLGDNTGADGTAAFADSETQALLDSDGGGRTVGSGVVTEIFE